MAETKEITRLYVVTDSETSYDNIGDIDGGIFNEDWLIDHIKHHGTQGLLEKLSRMITQVVLTETHYRQSTAPQPAMNVTIPKS